MQFVTKSMTEQFRNQNCLVIADSAFESMGIMEWGAHTDNKIAYCMTYGGNKICHPDYFSSKKSTMYKHFKNNEKRGATLVTHSDICTFTFFRDSSVMRLVDNDLDFETMTPRKIRRFNKNRQGDERWKGIARVNTFFFISLEKSKTRCAVRLTAPHLYIFSRPIMVVWMLSIAFYPYVVTIVKVVAKRLE